MRLDPNAARPSGSGVPLGGQPRSPERPSRHRLRTLRKPPSASRSQPNRQQKLVLLKPPFSRGYACRREAASPVRGARLAASERDRARQVRRCNNSVGDALSHHVWLASVLKFFKGSVQNFAGCARQVWTAPRNTHRQPRVRPRYHSVRAGSDRSPRVSPGLLPPTLYRPGPPLGRPSRTWQE